MKTLESLLQTTWSTRHQPGSERSHNKRASFSFRTMLFNAPSLHLVFSSSFRPSAIIAAVARSTRFLAGRQAMQRTSHERGDAKSKTGQQNRLSKQTTGRRSNAARGNRAPTRIQLLCLPQLFTEITGVHWPYFSFV